MKKLLSVLLVLIICFAMFPQKVDATYEQWDAISETFTVDNLNNDDMFPDRGFAQAVYDYISVAIQETDLDSGIDYYNEDSAEWNQYEFIPHPNAAWPDEATEEEVIDANDPEKWYKPLPMSTIIESGVTGDDLIRAILANYTGPINAQRYKIKDIRGFQLLKNTSSVDLQFNMITDITPFNGDYTVAGAYSFGQNPICKWPVSLSNTIRGKTHSLGTSYKIESTPVAYLFGETSTPTIHYNVYYGEPPVLNDKWYTKQWADPSAYDEPPPYIETNNTTGVILPTTSANKEGKALIEMGLTGQKLDPETGTLDMEKNSVSYISGMTPIAPSGTAAGTGTPGQGNSPSYIMGITLQRYGKLNIVPDTNVTGGFSFTKTDAETGDPVAGAEYTLYSDNACENAVGGPYTTGTDGVIKQGGFAPGTYYLKETDAPSGYSVNDEPVTITIYDPGATEKIVTGGVASFQHDVPEPDLNGTWGSDYGMYGKWQKLSTTTKTTKETLGSDAIVTNKSNIGYKKLSALSLQTENNASNYEQTNVQITISMGGVEYGVYDSDVAAKNAINSITENRELTGDIDIDYKCTFAEKEASYSGSGTQSDEHAETSDYSLKITKNNELGELLKDSGFKVYSDEACTALATVYADSEKTTLIENVEDAVLRTDENGILHFYGLEPGNTYYLKEVYAPTGYELQNPVKIAIDSDGGVLVNDEFDKTPEPETSEISITVTDPALVLDLPTTGSGGSMPFMAMGALIILISFVGLMVLNRKKHPKGNHFA